MMNNINLPNLNLCPTMRCNLKCKLCGVLVPQYDCRPHMTFDEFAATLKAVFEVADRVGKLQITGGEPLLHVDLPNMIKECFKYSDKFDKLWLFTNTTVPCKSELLEVLRKYKHKIIVHCSDYGVKRDVADEIIRALKDCGVEYKHLKYYGEEQYFDGWVDQGDFEAHNRTEAENAEIFAKCAHVNRGGSWYVRGGQMHWCGRSVRGTEVGKIPLTADDYLDVFDKSTSVTDKRDKLAKLTQAKCITACDYCNGYYGTNDTSRRYPAGEQF